MDDCNYKIFNNKRLMPKQEKRKEKEDETFDRSQYEILWTAKKAWEERRGGRGVRLVGLHVTLLDPQLERQLVLGL